MAGQMTCPRQDTISRFWLDFLLVAPDHVDFSSAPPDYCTFHQGLAAEPPLHATTLRGEKTFVKHNSAPLDARRSCDLMPTLIPLKEEQGRRHSPATCYDRFRRRAKAVVWDQVPDSLTEAYDGDIQVIDGTGVPLHRTDASQ